MFRIVCSWKHLCLFSRFLVFTILCLALLERIENDAGPRSSCVNLLELGLLSNEL